MALYRTHFPLLAKAAVDTGRLSVVAPLTYPVIDLAGDYVAPGGGDFAPHQDAGAWVGLEHWRYKKGTRAEIVQPDDPEAGRPVVAGWARESLRDPDAPYAVELKSFVIKGKSYDLPIGTTFYDPDNRLSAQVFALVERGGLPGVSLEFDAPAGYVPTVLKAKSPLEPHRPAWRFDRWDCHGWVNCARPVNPGALVAKSLALDPLRSVLAAGKIGSEVLHPVICKSLARYAPEPNRSRVTVEKAMPDTAALRDDTAPTEPTVYDDAHAEAADEMGTPTAQAAYNIAQMLVDACTHGEELLKKGEHVQGRKMLLRELEKIKAQAEKLIGIGDKVASDVGLGDDATGELPEDDAEVEEDAAEPDEEDEEKRMKAFRKPERRPYRKGLVRPFSKEEIAAAPPASPTPVDPEELRKKARLAKLQRALRRELLTS